MANNANPPFLIRITELSFASSHFSAAHAISAEFFGIGVECKRPADADYFAPIDATVTPEDVDRYQDSDENELVARRNIVVDQTLLAGGTFRQDLFFRMDGFIYTVKDVGIQDGNIIEVLIERRIGRNRSRPEYRGGR